MLWPFYALLGVLFASSVNFLDKYIIEKILKGGNIGSLILFSSIIGIPFSIIVFFINPRVIDINISQAFILILSGILYLAATVPYFYALNEDETSIVTPLLQMSSVFVLIFAGLFLNERLNLIQFIGCLTILMGAVGLTLEIKEKRKLKIKSKVLKLMSISSIFLSLNAVLFKYVAVETNLSTGLFWTYIGFIIFFLITYSFHSEFKKNFHFVITRNKTSVIMLNGLNEIQSILSIVLFSAASLMAPVALVSFFSEGIKPLFVLIIGLVFTKVLPKYIKENIERKYLIQKLIFILAITIGSYLIVV